MASNTQARRVADGGLVRRMDGAVESKEKLHSVLLAATRAADRTSQQQGTRPGTHLKKPMHVGSVEGV